MCYDLSAPPEKQFEQISYWLDFLQSSLPLSKDIGPTSKWRIIPVGLKKDLVKPASINNNIGSWKTNWSQLPIFDQAFFVSSHKHDSIKELLKVIEGECNRIFKQHTTKIPTAYKTLLQALQTIPEEKSVIPKADLFKMHPCGMAKEQFSVALQYLHSIGHVVVLADGLVCTVPKVIPKIAAKFISPADVRAKLLDSKAVEILEAKEIGVVLQTAVSDPKYEMIKF